MKHQTLTTIDEQVSEFIFKLYRLAQRVPIEEFKLSTFELLKPLIEIDSGLWVTRSELIRQVTNTEAFLYKQPEEMLMNYARVCPTVEDDELSELHLKSPGNTYSIFDVFTPEKFYQSKAYLQHCQHFEIEQALSTMHLFGKEQYHIISWYRKDKEHAFSEHERQVKNFIVPHWVEAFRMNLLVNTCDTDNPGSPSAICDYQGRFIEFEERHL